MRQLKPISRWQFAVFRIALGVYLIQHFAYLIPWGPEIWSDEGVLADPTLNLTHGVLPNPLEWWGTPTFVTGFLIVMLILSVAFTVGCYRRTAAALLWFGWACLFNRNNFISNPGIPYVGLILLLSVAVPAGEALRLSSRKAGEPWYFPAWVFRTAWILLAVGYTFSGLDKLLTSPSWQDGSSMLHLINNPLARPGPLRDLALVMPAWTLMAGTWLSLALEVLFLPLCFFLRGRLVAWAGIMGMHLGILFVIDFADLTFGMVMVHLFTLDPAWFPARKPEEGKNVVFFDGVCALCDRSMSFLIGEDQDRVLAYAPLQGETFAALRGGTRSEPEGIVYVRGFGTSNPTTLTESDAISAILCDVGGFWRPVSWFRFVPKFVRDRLYRWVARHRYQWFGRYDACRLPSPGQTELLP